MKVSNDRYSPKIKICGLTRVEDIEAVNVSRPDYIGFVFARRSRRFVTCDQAAVLRARLDDGITAVGVFSDADTDEVIALVERGVIDMVQLHGGEDASYVRRLRALLHDTARTDVQVIKALSADFFHHNDPSNGKGLWPLMSGDSEDCPDYLLIDNGAGGTGKTFDWSALRGLRVSPPFFLAGGIDEGNISAATDMEPYAVDVSSGAETDGVKDAAKIARLVRAVRSREQRGREAKYE
jgi:phosphoribosylanthranilate isomerase